ncbi:PLDc N-terminal domain-containing protein [uncultured Roseivirga sp.]|uniref:PLDc N-terminal domain-containing protein n=1 Tax=uncultured Roseivirga sp. TaxID=543088 RepID=UPI002594BB03|nr:PLDc N-terminal domain-containing protein [uncultured Roseivirga sp.]
MSMLFIILVFYLVPFLIVLVALVDILRSDFEPSQNKLIWVIVVILLPILGSILYLIIGRNQRRMPY